MNHRKKRGTNQFQQSWLTTYDWVKYKNATHVTCIVCLKDVAFDNMGETALKSHAKPNNDTPTKHQKLSKEKERSRRSLSVLHFRNVTSPSSSEKQATPQQEMTETEAPLPSSTTSSTSASALPVQPTLDEYVLPLSVANAEILWSMKVL